MTKQLVLVAVMLALAGGRCLAEGAVHSRTVDIDTSPTGKSDFKWDTGEFTFTGGDGLVTVKVRQGPNVTTMTAPKVSGKFTDNKVSRLVASGPMRVEALTPPDADGKGGSRVMASAEDRAEYSEVTQKITLYGNAMADYVALPEGPDSIRAHFAGEAIEADLNTKSLIVTKSHITADVPLKPKETPAAPAPAPKQ
jgi:hypothetical protein